MSSGVVVVFITGDYPFAKGRKLMSNNNQVLLERAFELASEYLPASEAEIFANEMVMNEIPPKWWETELAEIVKYATDGSEAYRDYQNEEVLSLNAK